MLTVAQSAFIVVLIVTLSVCFLFLLDRFWPAESRRQHNEIVGWQVSVVGMTYAVIIGFMLFAVWTDFEDARANVDAEANALVNLSRLAEGLPSTQREAVQAIAIHYADAMVSTEWPEMLRGGSYTPSSQILTQELWAAIVPLQNSHPQELDRAAEASLDHAISELTTLTEHRRLRELQCRTGLPGILWTVLIVGAIITIASACLFGSKNSLLHRLQVFALSTLIGLSLMAIAEIDRPFQGAVYVPPEAFIRAQRTLH